MRDSGRWIAGGILILLGVGFLLQQFGSIEIWNIFNYLWPLIFVAIGVSILSRRGNVTVAGVFIVVGVLLIIDQFFNLPFSIGDLWPLILVAIGLNILFRGKNKTRYDKGDEITDSNEVFDTTVVFWAENRKITSDKFRKGTSTAIFGGNSIDLRGAKFAENAELEATAIFGGTEIIVDRNTHVKSEGVGIFGGFVDQSENPAKPTGTLRIKGNAIFGAVEIKNKD